jgi:DNA-binding NtrC family response regulator
VGGEKPLRLALRIMIASNIRLEDMISKGMFREDLYYRINIVNILLPPLRERKEDIPPLCDYFVKMFALQHNKHISGLSYKAHRKIEGYDWPGNIRELKNAIHRAVIFCEKEVIDDYLIEIPETRLRASGSRPGPAPAERRKGAKGMTRQELAQALKKHGGNIKRAAAALGVGRLTVYYNLKKHGMDPDRYR